MSVAIITGASSGMGKCFVQNIRYYYPDIDCIWLVSRNRSKLITLAKKLKVDTKIIPLDLTNENDIIDFSAILKKEKPKIKVLVCSAGIGKMGPFIGQPLKEASNMIDVNIKGLTAINHLCIPYMTYDSHIINMCSAAAFICQSDFAVYAATKSYVLSFCDGIGKELKGRGIYVTAVCPGAVDTPFIKKAQKYKKIKSFKKLFIVKKECVVHKALWDSRWRRTRSIYGIPMKLFYHLCRLIPHKIMMLFV